MNNRTIIDMGIIVALFDRNDQWHEWTKQAAVNLPIPFLTCEAVMTEACFLLQHLPDGETDVVSLIEAGTLEIDFSLNKESVEIKELMQKYKSVPMSLADACLVRISELTDDSVVFTLDSDFWIYRKNGREEIPLIIPPR